MKNNQVTIAATIETNANLTYAFANDIAKKAIGYVMQDSQVWKDALSAANTAIAIAAQDYDATLGKFGPRFWRIATQELGAELRKFATPVSGSESVLEQVANYQSGKNVDATEGVKELSELEAISLNAQIDDGEGQSTEVGEVLEVPQVTPAQRAKARDNRNVLARLVKKLNKRERMIVILSKPYGETSYDVIGERLNLTRARVCQLREKALTKLQILASELV